MAGELLDYRGMPKLEPTIEEYTQAMKAYKTMPRVFFEDIGVRLELEKRIVSMGMTSALPLMRFTTGALSGEALLGGLARGGAVGAVVGTLAGMDASAVETK
jgi:hypothetical protein